MPAVFTHQINSPVYNGTVTVNTGLFINGEFVDPVDKQTFDVYNPATGKVLTSIAVGTEQDVDIAVKCAKIAYKNSWGLKVPGATRARMINKLADLIEQNAGEFAALETLNTGTALDVDVGKVFTKVQWIDVGGTVACLRYYAGWADKITGKTIEPNEGKMAYTRREPYGVVGQIIPWNFPLWMLSWKIGPALAAGNTIVLKPSELTPLSALKLASLANEAGFPPGVLNIVNGYGSTVGQAIIDHPLINKVAFTGSTVTGRKVLEASSRTNIKAVTLELGGKSPSIIFDDADVEQAVKWAMHGIFFNAGQTCTAGSRIFVQEGIYDKFLEAFTGVAQWVVSGTGDPFGKSTEHGPQISKTQFDRVMGYISSGKNEGATLHFGGERHGAEGYFIQPTIFTDCKPEMKIVREEIFGPVAVVIKFKDEAEAIEQANNTEYGLSCAIFSENINRAIRVSHAIDAGTAWINFVNFPDYSVPFGGHGQSGFGLELGEEGLESYTQLKSVQINLGMRL